MNPESTRMFAEAADAPHVVAAQLKNNALQLAQLGHLLRTKPPHAVMTCARGSSDHAATYAKYLIEQRVGMLVSSASPSLSSVYGTAPDRKDVLCMAISQSGKSPDLLATVSAAAGAGARTLAIVNDVTSPLAQAVETLIPISAGPELSVAATKSYIGSLSAIVQLVAEWSDDSALLQALDGLPVALAAAWNCDWTPLVDALVDANGLFVIGRGAGLGIAQEAALKFKETCDLHAEAFSAAEVQHGPMALMGPHFPLLIFRQSDATAPSVDALITAAINRDVPVFVAGQGPSGATILSSRAYHPCLEPIVQIQSFYRAVNALSLRRGQNPDKPISLSKITETI
jgi:glutamine---fructose-6-phosphate transaminase (isomerizing)